jgi:hypothetical protein
MSTISFSPSRTQKHAFSLGDASSDHYSGHNTTPSYQVFLRVQRILERQGLAVFCPIPWPKDVREALSPVPVPELQCVLVDIYPIESSGGSFVIVPTSLIGAGSCSDGYSR